jgi:hypothetical protein
MQLFLSSTRKRMQNYYKQCKNTTNNAKNITNNARLKKAKALKMKWLLILKMALHRLWLNLHSLRENV